MAEEFNVDWTKKLCVVSLI